jgi:1,4-alpha-glucan branching enzyme
MDFDPRGFQWIDCNDWENSVVTMMRTAQSSDGAMIMVFNYTPVPRHGYRVGVPRPGFYREVLNTDSAIYGGGNVGNAGGAPSNPVPWMGQPQSVTLTIPPLAAVFLRWEDEAAADPPGSD